MAEARQLRLLLWKDYLIRKRKPITLLGIAWAAFVMLSLYAVRVNISNVDYPTCQFAARALPSTGMLNFLQSFVCNVNNECSSMDEFEEIPSYENSRLTMLQRQLSPLLSNASVVRAVSTAPHAIQILATLADVADHPLFYQISKNGLRVSDIFRNAKRVKRYLQRELGIPEGVVNSILEAEVGFVGIVQGNLDKCNADSLIKTLKVTNKEHLTIFVNKLCTVDDQTLQNLAKELLLQADLGKYVTMIGEMYSKLSGDARMEQIGHMLEAVLKMISLESFLPPEFTGIIKGREPEFSYINLTMITAVMDQLQSTFGETESYKSLRDFLDTIVIGLEYLHKIITKNAENVDEESTDIERTENELQRKVNTRQVSRIFTNIVDVMSQLGTKEAPVDVFNILSRLTSLIVKWLPKEHNSDVLFYSTLLGKLIESADSVISINMHLEQLAYNVSLRNPKGVKVLMSLKPDIIEKGLQALTDAERTLILTSKLNDPGEMFCDTNRLKNFFLLSRDEAMKLKEQLCSNPWKDYIDDLISSFGIYDVKNNINSMASLFILSTLGKDISDQLYSIDKDFKILKNFTEHIKMMELEQNPVIDWTTIFKAPDDANLFAILREKSYKGKNMLITVHGALAKEVVSQNPLLEYKISPTLKNIHIMIDAINEQLDVAPRHLQKKAKELYPSIILTILGTAMDEKKSYKALSTSCQDMLCHGLERASNYFNFPKSDNEENLIKTLCNISKAIDDGLSRDSIIGKTIRKLKNTTHSVLEEIKWTKIITGLNNLYEKLNNDYTYIFEYKTFGMTKDTQEKVILMVKQAKEFWFNLKNLNRIMHISVKLGLRFLDLLDKGIFDITGEGWLKLKYGMMSATGPMIVADDIIQLIASIAKNVSLTTSLPPKTVLALQNILPNLPHFIAEFVDVIEKDNTDVNQITSLLNAPQPWPCATSSLADSLQLSLASHSALASLETLLCFNTDVKKEWAKYLTDRNANIFKTQTWNTTIFPENVFLKFSSSFDLSVKNLDEVNDIIEIAFDEDDDASFISALKHVLDIFNGTKGDVNLRKFFAKLDTILNSVNTSDLDTFSLHVLWKEYMNCTEDCQRLGRATWKYTLEYLSIVGGNATQDLFIYLKESNEQNATFLQLLGFTRNTGLFMLYDKLPDFVGVLINSYLDYEFLTQLYRASQSQFWDCEELLMSLNPEQDSPIDTAALKLIQPFICPSFLYWISMPRGINSIIDIFTKPQHSFFSLKVADLSSNYEKTYTNIKDIILLDGKLKKNTTKPQTMNLNTLQNKLENSIDTLLSFEIKNSDTSYQLFSERNKNYLATSIYLTRVVTIISKLVMELDNLKIPDEEGRDIQSLKEELAMLQKMFKRRSSEALAFHFDLITDVIANNNNKEYKIVDALKDVCERLNNKDNSKQILSEADRVKAQICGKKYEVFYSTVQHILDDDYTEVRNSLQNLIKTLSNESDATDIFKFFHDRQKLVNDLKKSIKYSHDLGIPMYLKYLQNNLKHYEIILSFLSGENWWAELRKLYSGPKANNFFGVLEKGFDITEDVLTHLDKIHLVRLLRDINMNDTKAICLPNVTLADYMPDGTGALSTLHRQICDTDANELFKELPSLRFAAQSYEGDLKISPNISYESLYSEITLIETKLQQIRNGPQSPKRPSWITEEKLKSIRSVVVQLLSKESLIKISFGTMSNFVDAGTMLMNNSDCTICSQLTSWFKQLNLQLYKKQEYDSLLCSFQCLTDDTPSARLVHTTLNNEFHWDMAISEIILTRNYTKYEFNKSLNELLEQIKLHLLEDVSTPSTKLFNCLASNVTGNAFGHSSLLAKVLARTARLLRTQLPYLHEVLGITNLPYLKQLQINVARNLHVTDHLSSYLVNSKDMNVDLEKVIQNKDLINKIEEATFDLFSMKNLKPVNDSVFMKDYTWEEICRQYDCEDIMTIISKHINMTIVEAKLPELQKKEFWQFNFISRILKHVETTVEHIGRVLGVLSNIDIQGTSKGNLAALLNTGLQIIMDDVTDSILYSISSIMKELHPIFQGTVLEHDVSAVLDGLQIMRQFRNYFINEDIKFNVSNIFSNAGRIEDSLSELGINNTNFWSIAAPRIKDGNIAIKPIFSQNQGIYNISDFVCQMDNMSKVLFPASGAVGVTVEDIYAAIIEQFCTISDDQAKAVIPVLLKNMNFDLVIDKLKTFLLGKLFAASNITQAEGDTVLIELGNMAAIIPELQGRIKDVSESLSTEPLLMKIKKSSSFGNMLASGDFLSEAGKLVCGKPFRTEISRFYKAIAKTEDLSSEPDSAQLDSLPTDYCRSLYMDILKMDGGKIVWSFIKPLILGKVLYTPSNPAVEKIILQANSTFEPAAKLFNLVHSFAHSFSSVDKLTEHKNGVDALKSIMSSPNYEELRKSLIGEVRMPNIDIDGIFGNLGDTQTLGALIRKASDLLRCISLDRFRAQGDEYSLAREAARLTMISEFSAGLVFLNMSKDQNEIPLNLEYKIRMDINNAPTTKRLKAYLWIPGPESDFLENMRYFRGFVQIQDIISKAVIQLSGDSHERVQKRETGDKDETDWAVYTQQVPYPCYRKDFFQTSLYESQSLIVAFFFSLLFTVSSVVRFIVADKESGNTMLMSVMGVRLRYHTASWAVCTLVELALAVGGIVAVLCGGGVLPRSDPFMLYLILLSFSLSVLAFCYMMSTLCSSASSGAVVGGIAYLITFMPFVLILSLEAVLSSPLKIFVSLSMSSSLCYAFLLVTRLEAMGVGAGWAQLWDSPGGADMSIAVAVGMILLDGCLYTIIGYIINHFYGIKSVSNITVCPTSGEKAGVSIVGVSKLYGSHLALDNVSMELHKGQITTLLGHNGAGKTTLIKILTGMLKPSKGHVIVRCEDTGKDGEVGYAGARLGVCPQRDVLFEYMTAREHIALYAQLKSGKSLSEVQDEVDTLEAALGLGELGGRAAARLSGGTRRRLCVALAFVARPALVSLDEPTAGVDPAARRDIWSMIMKLRDNRTILLTTHHLDEAELLSDQIVIMHKGRIHTTGSPIDIKRALGTGYKLTVMYPDRHRRVLEDTDNEEVSIEEKTKNLLEVTKSVVKNANLLEVNGFEVEINLPFYDSDGLNNNFLDLSLALEKRREELAYRSVSLDCSSLEQVFHTVCHQHEFGESQAISSLPDTLQSTSKSESASSVRRDSAPLVSIDGALRGSLFQQFTALMYARYLHYIRNRWLLFLVIVLPCLFLTVAMAFSTIRPPADAETALHLHPDMYQAATQFAVSHPSMYTEGDSSFAQQFLDNLRNGMQYRNLTNEDFPKCKCMNAIQHCDIDESRDWRHPELMIAPDVQTLNKWLVDSQQVYVEKRYTGYSAVVRNSSTVMVAWYNNKGHHSLPAALSAIHTDALRARRPRASLAVYSHPLKISKENLNKDTVYQHIADAGISGMVLIAYSLASAGGALYAVSVRRDGRRRLLLLAAAPPPLLATSALLWDIAIIIINIVITAIIFEIFHFPVFVARNNLPAICILILLYGFACGGLVHVAEKAFSEASIANMLLFCGNAFAGLAGITLLLVLDIISDSEQSDYTRWVLHKIFLLSPQFALGDGLLEISKNTIQATVLSQFGMDTYRDPLKKNVVGYHYVALVLVGTFLFIVNLALEYDFFDIILSRFRSKETVEDDVPLAEDVRAEEKRVCTSLQTLRLCTIGNINAGFIDTEDIMKNGSLKRPSMDSSGKVRVGVGVGAGVEVTDVCSAVRLRRTYGSHVALHSLTLGIPPGECTALLGENGAGKSTTFSLLTGQLRATAGHVAVRGQRVSARQLCQGHISYCPQSDAVDPLLTVEETLNFYCMLRGIDNREEVIRRTLVTFELKQYADVRSAALSGGNRRKLCSAIAFMSRTSLVLLDEPTSGMDPSSRGCVARGVRGAAAAGRAALLSTHALDDARRLAARVALLKAGRLVAVASLDNCLRRFGGGYIVSCRTRGSPRATWRRVAERAPYAVLRVLHHSALHFLIPTHANVEGKEVITNLSDIFRLLAELQMSCDIEDYTVNQSSLDQMFLNFSERTSILEPEETPQIKRLQLLKRRGSEELHSVTSL